MEYILSLPWDQFTALLAEAAEQRRREEIRQEWIAQMPWMGKDNFVSFEDYYAQRVVKPLDGPRKSKEELLAEAMLIRAAAQGTPNVIEK